MTRNEKLLACIASGTWVLHKSYLEASREEGKFVSVSKEKIRPSFTYSPKVAMIWGGKIVKLVINSNKFVNPSNEKNPSMIDQSNKCEAAEKDICSLEEKRASTS